MKIKKGLTLIELLIAVSIIALMAVAGFFLAKSQYLKGRDARRKADIHKIQEALEEYEKDHDCYPAVDLVVCQPGMGLIPYVSKIPCDPATNLSYYYENNNNVCAKWYRIFIFLDNLHDRNIIQSIGPNGGYNFYLASPNAPVPVSISPTPFPSPTPTGLLVPDEYYGCVNGVCVSIPWNPARPGPWCDPNYQNPSCYGQCGPQAYECIRWNQ